MKGSRSEPDADEDRDEGFDEGGKDTEGPVGGDEQRPGGAQATSQRSPFSSE